MESILSFLNGKKTYITGIAGLIVVALFMLNVIDGDVANKALVALGFTGMITFRAGMAKTEAKAAEAVQQVAALQRGERPYIG